MLLLSPSPLCQSDIAALVTDGANTVCDRFVSGPWVMVSVALVIAFVLVWRARPAVRNRILLGATVLSLPGFHALAVLRADAPLEVVRTAARLERIERGLEDDARSQGCEANVPGPCEACQPIARFARARRGVCIREPAVRAPSPSEPRDEPSRARCSAEDLGCFAP